MLSHQFQDIAQLAPHVPRELPVLRLHPAISADDRIQLLARAFGFANAGDPAAIEHDGHGSMMPDGQDVDRRLLYVYGNSGGALYRDERRFAKGDAINAGQTFRQAVVDAANQRFAELGPAMGWRIEDRVDPRLSALNVAVQSSDVGRQAVQQTVIDVGVRYHRQIGGTSTVTATSVPVIGAGSFVMMTYDAQLEMTSLQSCWRSVDREHERAQVRDPLEALAEARRRLGLHRRRAAVTSERIRFGYFAMDVFTVQQFLEPAYEVMFEVRNHGESGHDFSSKHVFVIPAGERPVELGTVIAVG